MFQRSSVREGLAVRSQDGEKLGKVVAVEDDSFFIEKGFFFPKDYRVRYADIQDIRGDEIILLHGIQNLRELSREEKDLGTAAAPGSLPRPETADARDLRTGDEVAIPIHREELDVRKVEQRAGEVRVQKEVISEQEEVPVTLRKERVAVERRDVRPERPAMNASFRDETIVVPVHAEEARVEKRAVVDEEVVVRKDAEEEQRRIADTVRREQVDVGTEGAVEEGRAYSSPEEDPRNRRG